MEPQFSPEEHRAFIDRMFDAEFEVEGNSYSAFELLDSVITCKSCGGDMEPDAEECYDCGKPNPLMALGLI